MSLVIGFFISECRVCAAETSSSTPQPLDFRFDGNISRKVLENYLDHSVTMAYFLVTGTPERNRQYLYREDDIRLIENIGAKFIGRAMYRWGGESRLNEPGFWSDAKALIDRVHSFDPDVIFQGCLFEVVTRDVDRVNIPSWVFDEFGLPVQQRTFADAREPDDLMSQRDAWQLPGKYQEPSLSYRVLTGRDDQEDMEQCSPVVETWASGSGISTTALAE